MANRLVQEDDAGDVDGAQMELGTGRNGVIAGFETGDSGEDQIERLMPSRGVFLRRRDVDVGIRDESQNFSEFEASVDHHPGVLFLIGSKSLSESGVEGFNVDNGVLLIAKTQSVQQAVNLDIWVARPYADVVTMLVISTGTLNVEFHMNVVSSWVDIEEFMNDGDGSWEGVLGILGILRSCQSRRRVCL